MKKFLLTLPIIAIVLLAESQTFECGTSILTDVDGFQYHTVLMGSQCWTKENMRTIHYANGLPVGIPKKKTGFHELINMPGKLQLNLNLLSEENINIEIYNSKGAKIYYSTLWCSSGSNTIDCSIGPVGFYLVNISSETLESTFKVIGGDQSSVEVILVSSAPGYKSETVVLDPNPRFYYDYDNDPANDEKFGKLYTWASATNVEYDWTVTLDSVIQGICPDGWHVSNDSDWTQLQLFIGMTEEEIAAEWYRPSGTKSNKLKSPDTTYWFSSCGTDDYGFSARGSGWYFSPPIGGGFILLRGLALWLSYTNKNGHGPLTMDIENCNWGICKNDAWVHNGDAYSVRCVKDY
jgi:uncharacterized protein (TIGR02145 family)